MPELIPQENDNLKLLGADGFSSIKEYVEPYYSTSDYFVVQDAKDRFMVVVRGTDLDTHMHNGWHETIHHINQWKYINR